MTNKSTAIALGLVLSLSTAFSVAADPSPVAAGKWSNASYQFERGFPTGAAAQKAYDDIDLTRAVEAYRFFYPTVSGSAIFKGNAKLGIVPNKVFGTLDTQPKHVGFTLNSDTPYAPLLLDLSQGPMVVELPAGPLICIAMDVNQLWVADLGLPGPAAGKGDKVVFLPPGYRGAPPAGYRVAYSPSNKMLVGIRSLPVGGDVPAAVARIKTVKVYPLKPVAGWPALTWLDLTPPPQDTSPVAWENNIQFWRELAEVIESEPPNPRFHNMYGELAALGIEKGKLFKPDARMTGILEKAAKLGNAQLRVESFGDRRLDRSVWPDRKWEWAALRYEDGDFNTANYADLYARDKWFYQAIGASPAMFKRDPTAGSLYWLGLRDAKGATLDGGKSYKLSVPQPVPGKLFWSVTVYDVDTRSQVSTDQGKAALRSLFELKNKLGTAPLDLYFGPKAPAGHEDQWIKTIPGKGWFAYFRIYGPEKPAFDGSWKPGDFEVLEMNDKTHSIGFYGLVTLATLVGCEQPAQMQVSTAPQPTPVVATPPAGPTASSAGAPAASTATTTPEDSPSDLGRRMLERRAVEAAIWGMPAVNYDLMLQEMLSKTEGKVNQVIYWGHPLNWHNQTLTPNPDTLYFMAFFNTKDVGPIVIEVPPADSGALNANFVNVWQEPLEDAGPLGVDKGKGVKLLLLPPGYMGKIPAGYEALKPGMFGSYALFRSNLKSHAEADIAKSAEYAKRVKVYPLSQASKPPPTAFTDVKDVVFDSTIRYDARFFDGLNRIVQSEPWRDRDRALIDSLASLGIEKGKPYAPTAETKQALDASMREAHRELAARYDAGLPAFFEGTHWSFPTLPELVKALASDFADPNTYPIDARGLTYSYAYIGIKRLGTGQFYLISIKDRDGKNYDGAKTYHLHVPPNAPVEQYWSVTAYDRETHALIKNVNRASRASNSTEVQKNADGSVDLYLGPQAPAGKESNFIPTDPARHFELMFRLYAPTKALFEKAWKLPDVEKMN